MVKPEPSSGTCNNNLPVSGVISSGSQSTFPPTNAIDDKLNTKWGSTFIVKPFITLDSGGLKSVCSVDIAWADGSSHPNFFLMFQSPLMVLLSPTYFLEQALALLHYLKNTPCHRPQTQARYVKITNLFMFMK